MRDLSPLLVRTAELSDVAEMVSIYNAELATAHFNYETKPQEVQERKAWLAGLQERNYPVLVAVWDKQIVGYAALTPFHSLSGYRFTVTGSVYVLSEFRRKGVGRALLNELRIAAIKNKFHTVIAGVNSENKGSIGLLKTFGFQEAGRFREIGFKNGAWHDDVCLQLVL